MADENEIAQVELFAKLMQVGGVPIVVIFRMLRTIPFAVAVAALIRREHVVITVQS